MTRIVCCNDYVSYVKDFIDLFSLQKKYGRILIVVSEDYDSEYAYMVSKRNEILAVVQLVPIDC